MKKLIVVFLASVAMLFGMTTPAGASGDTLPPRAAVFFSPHQDDEVLTMGAAVREHVRGGRPTYVVLLTDGGSSKVCLQKFSTRAECTAYRDAEFNLSVRAMGAIPIIPSNRMIDGQTTVAGLQKIMRPYLVDGFSLKTFTPVHDTHRDHLNAGKALAGLKFTDTRYYVKSALASDAKRAGTNVRTTRPCPDSECQVSINAYGGFGWLSVPASFKVANESLVSHWYAP